MKNNPVGWFEIYVQDMARAKAFYETMLGGSLEHLPSPDIEMWAFPMHESTYGAPGALVQMKGCPSGPGGTMVYFSTVDCAVEAARAGANGGQVVREKFSIGEWGFIALVTDTEGNMIGLHSMQ